VDPRLLGAILTVLGGALVVIYARAFHALPSADDFIIPAVVRSGLAERPWRYFLNSPMEDYRPLQWIVASLVMRPAIRDPFPVMHLMSFACFIPYAAALALWLLRLRLGPVPAACATAFVFFHPTLAGPFGDVDTFIRFITSAFVWLGAYAADRLASRLSRAIPVVVGCFALGLGFSEYALGLLVLASIAVVWQRPRNRWAGAATMAIAMLVVFGGYMALRRVAVVGSSVQGLTLNPIDWMRNSALMVGALLYPGNTVEIALAEGPSRSLWLAAGCGAVALWITAGLWLRRRNAPLGEMVPITYVAILFAASLAPMFARSHVSEEYLTAPLVGLALLVGQAAEGWCATGALRLPAFVTLAVLLAWGIASSSEKLGGIVERGERTGQQIRSLLAHIPPDARDTTVWLVFPEVGRRYSMFVAGDDYLIQPGGPAQRASQWLLPGRGIRLRHVRGERAVPPGEEAGVVLCWASARRSFWQSEDGTCPASQEGLGAP
jgi:hypothetical protein